MFETGGGSVVYVVLAFEFYQVIGNLFSVVISVCRG